MLQKKRHKGKKWLKRHVLQPYTIMMVPHSQDKTIQFRIPVGVISMTLVTAVALCSASGYLAYRTAQYQQVKEQNVVLQNSQEELVEQLKVLQNASGRLEQVLLENQQLSEINAEQQEKIDELSRIAADTMNQMEEILFMQNELRIQLGFEPISGMGGPKNETLEAAGESVASTVYLNDISESFTDIRKLLSSQEEGILEISSQVGYLNSIPTRWPVESRNITSEFGTRENPFGGSSTEVHGGIDVGCPTGTPIYASGRGEVVVAGWQSGYGYTVVIDHGYEYSSRYSHCSKLLVSVGTFVEAGEQIALVGSTGRSTGPHLDFRIRFGEHYIDPLNILRK